MLGLFQGPVPAVNVSDFLSCRWHREGRVPTGNFWPPWLRKLARLGTLFGECEWWPTELSRHATRWTRFHPDTRPMRNSKYE